jgi:glycosyltransferase involved in cell wall biosynthesis
MWNFCDLYMKIVVTIPAYNEEKTLPPVLEEIKKELDNKYDYQLLVLNDGSKDRTVEIAQQHGAKVYSNKRNLGLAKTFKAEMRECLKYNPDIIVHTDADGQYPAKYIPALIEKVKLGNDLVLGTRFEKGKYSGSIAKNLGNQAFAKVFSSLLKVKLTDTTTGFRAFNKTVAELPLINNFTYTQEQLIRVGKEGLSVSEVPIRTRPTRKSRLFKSPLHYAVKAWINILRIYRDYEPLKFFGKIGGSFFFVGFLLGLYIFITFLITDRVGGIPRVMLSAMLMLTGLQIIIFGFLADMNNKS